MNRTSDKIEQLTHIIQQGVGITRTDASMDIFLDKVTGSLPLGSDAANFSTRKKLILMQYFNKTIGDFVGVFFGFFLTIIFGSMSYFEFSEHNFGEWWIPIATIVFLVLFIIFFKSMKENYKIFRALRNVQPTQADPQPRPMRVENEMQLAQQFGKQRLQSRIVGLGIMLITGYVLYGFFSHPPERVLKIVIILPFFFMLGLSLIINPINRAENMYRYNSAQISWQHMPIISKILVIIGAIASMIFLAIIEGFISI